MNVPVLAMGDFETTVAPPVARSAAPTVEIVAAIYDTHQRELFTFAVRACRDHEAAEDFVHEAFVRLIAEVDADRTPRHPRAWLYRVVANLIVSRVRHASVAERHATPTGGEDAGPEPAYLERERQAHLDVVLGELDEDARTALLMAASGFNGMEIAEAIGRSGNATRTLMCRTRLQLRHRLESYGSLT
jgi:RNA polymerase sigma factor (sigma-70 family)